MREEAAWRYKLLILLGLVTLFTLLTMPYTAYIVSTAHTAYYTTYPFKTLLEQKGYYALVKYGYLAFCA